MPNTMASCLLDSESRVWRVLAWDGRTRAERRDSERGRSCASKNLASSPEKDASRVQNAGSPQIAGAICEARSTRVHPAEASTHQARKTIKPNKRI